ncbi:MAG: Aspartyl aminopeptidase [Anaerocolumna sp.]|jgi:aspartyl aminopeptidase|nr:Aspartyl aminopeptidase [Anaerocolumna sp.]
MMSNKISELLTYINNATSPYQAVEEGIKKLEAEGFLELKMKDSWELQPGKAYYVNTFGTTLFAFTIGSDFKAGQNLRIAAAHTDQPGFHVKPKAEMNSNEYLKLDTEVYGGPILNTWLDRPLSIAGRVALRSKEPFHPDLKLMDVRRPVLTIPNLAIHINREVNKGLELNKQMDTLPLMAMLNETINKDDFFLRFIGEQLGVEKDEILDFDLYIYNAEEACLLGMKEEFISGPRLDNLTSVLALLNSIIAGRRSTGINLIALYDNEEVGSKSKQGADSALLNMLLEKIYIGLECDKRNQMLEAVADGMLLSVDVAHGLHPNRPERYDPINQTILNGGVVFKIDTNQKYTFDTEAVAIMQQICENEKIKYQKFVKRSDMPGGQTLGPIISSWLPMKTIDLGVPLLAMHSARETMGVLDQGYLESLVSAFFRIEA